MTGPTGAQSATTWDYLGRKLTSTQVERYSGSGTANYTTGYSYDDSAGGWLSQLTSPDGVTTKYAYNPAGEQVSVTDGASNTTGYGYDSLGRQTKVTYPDGNDAAGHQTLYTDGNGGQWWNTYNSWGLQESRVEPAAGSYNTAATSTFTTAYDADQNPVTLTEPGTSPVTVTSTYNKLDELTGQSGTGAEAATPTRSFGYDTAGNLTTASTSNTLGTGSNATSETFTYNDRGNVLTATGTGGPATLAYNGDDLLSSVADAAGTTSYTYDNADRLSTLANPVTGATATYSYNPELQVSGISYGSGKDSQAFGYDTQHRLTSDTLKTSSGTTIASEAYGYNPDNEITSQTTTGLAGTASNTYTYDEADRLTSWNNGSATTNYAYDSNGNLTRNGTRTLSYDARDELTGDGGSSYTYTARGTSSSEPGVGAPLAVSSDAYGDQMTAGSRGYAYDALGRLTGDTLSGGTNYAFTYVGSTETLASDGLSTYTWDPTGGTLVGAGTVGGGTGGVQTMTDLHTNLIGQFTPAGTSLAGSKAYDPWGVVTATTGTPVGLLGYQSAWTDNTAGKNLMGARWYNPSDGDFTSRDTVTVNPDPDPAAGDPFAYAADEPLDLTDPSGHRVIDLPGEDANPEAAANVISTSQDLARRNGLAAAAKTQAATAATKAKKAPTAANVKAAKAAAAKAATAKSNAAIEKAAQAKAVAAEKAAEATAAKKAAATAAKQQAVKIANARSAAHIKDLEHKAQLPGEQTSSRSQSNQPQDGHSPKLIGGYAPALAGCTAMQYVHTGDCPSERGAAGTTAEQVKQSLIGAGTVLISAIPGLDVLDWAIGAGRAASAVDDGVTAARTADEAASVGDDASGAARNKLPTCGGQSFAAGTLILLASGKATAISKLSVGDKVLADHTKTGQNQAEAVTTVLVHHDTNLYDLTIKTGHRTQVIHTTSNHLFWDPYPHYGWIPANHLKQGMHLKTPDGQSAVVVGGSVPADHDGWMWDLTVPGNNDHDFYVAVAATAVLVHNCAAPSTPGHIAATADVSTEPDTAYVWTGLAERDATALARSNGGTTLEGALDSRGVVMPAWDPADPAVAEAWYTVSARYAAAASGRVTAIVGPGGIRADSVFATIELPTLLNNPGVTGIDYISGG